jgi:CyaY protein
MGNGAWSLIFAIGRQRPYLAALEPDPTFFEVATMSLSEARFHDLVDATQQALEELLEDHADDIEITAGMMTIKFDNGSQLIISRQEPLRQLWLAARSGGFHFDYDEESGKWSCEKSEELLGEVLARCVQDQTGLELDFEEI